jgi:hypothetical protein
VFITALRNYHWCFIIGAGAESGIFIYAGGQFVALARILKPAFNKLRNSRFARRLVFKMGENALNKIIQTFHVHALNRFVIVQGAKHIKVKAVILFKFIVVFQIIQIIHNLRIKMAVNRRGAKKQDGSKAFLCGNGHQVDHFIVCR